MHPLGTGPCPDKIMIDIDLVKIIKQYMIDKSIKEAFFADQIVTQQIKDIPNHSDRIRFDEDNTSKALENNRRHINRYLNDDINIPLRIVPTILRVMGIFPQIEQSRLDDFGHLSKTAKEALEAVDRYRTAIDDGTITQDEATEVWTEGFQAICALLGMMFYTQDRADR